MDSESKKLVRATIGEAQRKIWETQNEMLTSGNTPTPNEVFTACIDAIGKIPDSEFALGMIKKAL